MMAAGGARGLFTTLPGVQQPRSGGPLAGATCNTLLLLTPAGERRHLIASGHVSNYNSAVQVALS